MKDKASTLQKLSEQRQEQYAHRILAARVKGETYSLNKQVDCSEQIDFLDISTSEGYQVYQRSLCFTLIKAAHDLYPAAPLIVKHSLGKGIYCEWGMDREPTQDDVSQLESRMRMIIEADIPFIEQDMDKEDAIQIFKMQNAQDKVYVLRYNPDKRVTMHSLSGYYNYFNGCLVPSTGYLKEFGLSLYPPGLLLHMPDVQGGRAEGQIIYNKISTVMLEADNWAKYLDSQYVSDLNKHVQDGSINEILWLAEALHEKRLVELANLIAVQRNKLRLVLIAGPSASGKTTFAKRLMIHLRVNGLKPVAISMDNYFLPRNYTPIDEAGEFDFENISALDLPLFNQNLQDLMDGKDVLLPRYNFLRGTRETGKTAGVGTDQPIIIEGIHGLNEQLTGAIGRDKKFKIYVSALTSIGLDYHNSISTTDTRILRRIVRDSRYRNYQADQTIQIWPAVRRGEQRNIFPFQEEADSIFNSSLLYEWSVLRTAAEPLLKEIGPESKAFKEANRLLHFLSYFQPMDISKVPGNSILREFIGGSSLE